MAVGEQGEQGDVGERGDSGQRGVAGERGPKGDHGQHGERGPTGATNRYGFVGYLILVGVVLLGFWFQREADMKLEQTASLICRVANENRESLRATFVDARDRTRTSKQRTPEEKAEAEIFYRDALRRLPADPCKPPTLGEVIP